MALRHHILVSKSTRTRTATIANRERHHQDDAHDDAVVRESTTPETCHPAAL